MKLTFESELLMPPVSQAISILTDGAKVFVNDIRYDKANEIVEIYLLRNEITGYKTSFWGNVKPVYGQTTVKSLLTIRQVEEFNIKLDERLVAECNSTFTVLFGLKVDKNRLYLGSAEETQGKVMCQIIINIKKLDIEYTEAVSKL